MDTSSQDNRKNSDKSILNLDQINEILESFPNLGEEEKEIIYGLRSMNVRDDRHRWSKYNSAYAVGVDGISRRLRELTLKDRNQICQLLGISKNTLYDLKRNNIGFVKVYALMILLGLTVDDFYRMSKAASSDEMRSTIISNLSDDGYIDKKILNKLPQISDLENADPNDFATIYKQEILKIISDQNWTYWQDPESVIDKVINHWHISCIPKNLKVLPAAMHESIALIKKSVDYVNSTPPLQRAYDLFTAKRPSGMDRSTYQAMMSLLSTTLEI